MPSTVHNDSDVDHKSLKKRTPTEDEWLDREVAENTAEEYCAKTMERPSSEKGIMLDTMDDLPHEVRVSGSLVHSTSVESFLQFLTPQPDATNTKNHMSSNNFTSVNTIKERTTLWASIIGDGVHIGENAQINLSGASASIFKISYVSKDTDQEKKANVEKVEIKRGGEEKEEEVTG